MNTFVCVCEEDNILDHTEAGTPEIAADWFHNKYEFTEETEFYILFEFVSKLNTIEDGNDPVLRTNRTKTLTDRREKIIHYVIKDNKATTKG